MTITNTITGTKITASSNIIEKEIAQQIIWLNEEESDKPKEKRYYYTRSNFKISK